jgi:hypothetical protein
MYDSALQIKNCRPDQNCLIREPWGRANWEIDKVTEKLWLGTWHDDRFDAQSYRSITLRMQARFLIPNHLTDTYVGCSKWVYYADGSATQQTCQVPDLHSLAWAFGVERVTRIELALSAWELP